jgi:hypothetical protein
MTPKEKAKEIYQKYCNMNSHCDNAIECSLVAVDEIIKSNPTSQLSDPFLGNRTYENVNYWEQVKQEINKL